MISPTEQQTADKDLAATAERQHQIVTRAQLIRAGVDDMAMCRRAKKGQYQRVLPAVYSLVTGTLTVEQRRIAAALYAGPDAQITGLAALEWYGFRYAPRTEKVQLIVPHHARRRSVGHAVIQRALTLDERPRHTEVYTVCSPARAVVDACRELRDLRTVRAIVAESIQRNYTSLKALDEEVRRARRSRTALVRRALKEVIEGIRSAAEADLRDCLSTSRILPEILWNPSLRTADGTALPTPDAWIAEASLAVEVDSREFHFAPEDWRRSLDRHNVLGRYGILVLHFTPAEIRQDPARVRRIVEDAYRARRGTAASCEVLVGVPS
ncbi:type IV toxin-antitoxin system AbiEi family antitoxin domain-containing protein [Phytohabitans rumicis]|uniref:AbiEi antitoxin N-terminal domain-containing protein n=1 Tax=Phytohabitans rumicis TaxID=1076125 RepID=A0A6V8LAM6_9ACTN|nr:type IV toxin-antitoxin system AbiEi family antitoxin domain-containing protein [Phytohabitans rumicis]GFJ92088.1 hypothetical protein Prum_057300 [Phytohabitans rumicis]